MRWTIPFLAFCNLILFNMTSVLIAGDSVRSKANSIAEIVAVLKRSEAQLKSISVSSHAVCKYSFCEPGTEPENPTLMEDSAVASKQVSDMVWFLKRDGSGRYEASIDVTNIRFDESTVVKKRLFLSVFDGARGYGKYLMSTQAPDASWHGEERAESRFVCGHDNPLEYICEFLPSATLSQTIIENHVQIVGTQILRGQRLVVLESRRPAQDAPDRQRYFQLLFDNEKNCVVRKQVYVRLGVGLPWYLGYQRDWLDSEYLEDAEIWLPTVVHSWNWVVNKEGRRYSSSEKHFIYKDWQINKPIDKDLFSIADPLKALNLPASE